MVFFSRALREAISIASICSFIFISTAYAQETSDPGILAIGDAVVTGFSGVVEPLPQDPPLDPPLSREQILDETLINVDGLSARIDYLSAPGFVWDARVWPANRTLEFAARDIGQVFGVAFDDAEKPNIYFSATSAYGLHIVKPDEDNDGRPERLKQGDPAAEWMAGQWGRADAKDGAESRGGPGTIWKVDGTTGEITFFAETVLEGANNPGAGLGNIIYVAAQKSLFVSDLSTGYIHRFNLNGEETGLFDHGVTGRESAQLAAVSHDPSVALDIKSSDFDPEDPDTWGLTAEDRRVQGLAYNNGRLYYAVTGGSQIWSVGFEEKTGEFLTEARWEIDVPEKPKALPITDMLFTHKGALVLAQRGEVKSTYDYSGFAAHGKARVYRYWLESPDNPETKSIWIEEPEEHAVGFEKNNRQTSGGLALNHGYTDDGYIDTAVCEASLWTTGDDLRLTKDDELIKALTPGGPLIIDGLQGMPAGPVKQYEKGNNTPPFASYMLDNDPDNTGLVDVDNVPLLYSDELTQGWMGDVEILRTNCDAALAGSGGGYFGGAGYGWSTPRYIYADGGDGTTTTDPNTDPTCTPGIDCPAPASCAKPEGTFTCDPKTGSYVFALNTGNAAGLNADTIKITGTSPGITIAEAPLVTAGSPTTPLTIGGTASGQLMSIGLCLFNKAEMASGKPFTCCKTAVTALMPTTECKKQN
jgi:hypothetical protein